jgi:glycosyltransferase involved in cell wall biosynthesis
VTLVVSPEPVGARMAGPAIRAVELARALGAELVSPAPTEHRAVLERAREHEVVVVQHPPPQLLLALAREDVQVVADLYTPIPLEALQVRSPDRARIVRLATRQTAAALAAADVVVCASERQRDLWTGALAVHGLDTEVLVVPFGVPAEPPVAAPVPVPDGRVLIWGGGVWDWLDAGTPIRALHHLPDDVHLLFLGLRRPVADEQTAGARAVELARTEGLLGTRVHVNEDWVPYAERGAWLLAAAAGVTAHHPTLETRFAFRTRVLDYCWAGLPVVGTEGDTLTDALQAGVPAHDPRAFALAVEEVLADPEPAAARSRALAEELRWERVVEPLAEWCAAPPPRRARPLGLLARATAAQYPDTLARTWRDEGAGVLARRVARNAGRLVGVGS